MAELTIERVFNAAPARVFAFITESENLVKWWGPEGMSLPEHALDFTRLGPWNSTMQNSDGQRFHVSGQVTSVDAPHLVAFTWAWHDESGNRGEESHVTMTVKAAENGRTAFTLVHRKLGEEAAVNHEKGWTSSLVKLERLAS